MPRSWILVAARGGARLYEYVSPEGRLAALRTIPHPEGRLFGRQLDSDRPGRSFDSTTPGRHAMLPEHDARDAATHRFARQLAHMLREGRVEERFEQLVLVAEAKFLGLLRAALDAATAQRVAQSFDRDLSWVAEADMRGHLQALLSVAGERPMRH